MRKTLADLEKARLSIKGEPRSYDPNRVMPKMCATCPYLPDGQGLELTEETMFVMKTDPDVGNQYCHSPAWSGKPEDVICRGHRDHWLAVFVAWGFMAEPTDKAWTDKLTEGD